MYEVNQLFNGKSRLAIFPQFKMNVERAYTIQHTYIWAERYGSSVHWRPIYEYATLLHKIQNHLILARHVLSRSLQNHYICSNVHTSGLMRMQQRQTKLKKSRKNPPFAFRNHIHIYIKAFARSAVSLFTLHPVLKFYFRDVCGRSEALNSRTFLLLLSLVEFTVKWKAC